MSFLENGTFSFWENDAVSEIGTVLEIIPRLQNWAIWPAHTLRMAPITWACPVIVQSVGCRKKYDFALPIKSEKQN